MTGRTGGTDSAGTPWAGRVLGGTGFDADDGAADPALLACAYYPSAPAPRLHALAALVVWIGLLDDVLEAMARPEPLGGLVDVLVSSVLAAGEGSGGGTAAVPAGRGTGRGMDSVREVLVRFEQVARPILDAYAPGEYSS